MRCHKNGISASAKSTVFRRYPKEYAHGEMDGETYFIYRSYTFIEHKRQKDILRRRKHFKQRIVYECMLNGPSIETNLSLVRYVVSRHLVLCEFVLSLGQAK